MAIRTLLTENGHAKTVVRPGRIFSGPADVTVKRTSTAGRPPGYWSGISPKTSWMRRRSRSRGSVAPPTQRLTVLTEHAQQPRGGLLGQSLPAQRDGHPVGEVGRAVRPRRDRDEGGAGRRHLRPVVPGRPRSPAAASPGPACASARARRRAGRSGARPRRGLELGVQDVHLDMLRERCGTRPGWTRTARRRRAARGRRYPRPRGCPPPSAATRPGSGGRNRGYPGSTRGAREIPGRERRQA